MSDTQQQPSPETPLTVTLTVVQWRGTLEQLSNGPFRVVESLIREIEKQCNAQMQQRQQPQARSNGALAEEHANA